MKKGWIAVIVVLALIVAVVVAYFLISYSNERNAIIMEYHVLNCESQCPLVSWTVENRTLLVWEENCREECGKYVSALNKYQKDVTVCEPIESAGSNQQMQRCSDKFMKVCEDELAASNQSIYVLKDCAGRVARQMAIEYPYVTR